MFNAQGLHHDHSIPLKCVIVVGKCSRRVPLLTTVVQKFVHIGILTVKILLKFSPAFSVIEKYKI